MLKTKLHPSLPPPRPLIVCMCVCVCVCVCARVCMHVPMRMKSFLLPVWTGGKPHLRTVTEFIS